MNPVNKMLRDLVAWLGTDTATAAMVATRITIDGTKQGEDFPYVVLQLVGEDRNNDQLLPSSDPYTRSATVQIDCYATTPHQSRELANVVETAVCKCGQYSGDTIFESARFQSSQQSYGQNDSEGLPQGSETTARMAILFNINYQPVTL